MFEMLTKELQCKRYISENLVIRTIYNMCNQIMVFSNKTSETKEVEV